MRIIIKIRCDAPEEHRPHLQKLCHWFATTVEPVLEAHWGITGASVSVENLLAQPRHSKERTEK